MRRFRDRQKVRVLTEIVVHDGKKRTPYLPYTPVRVMYRGLHLRRYWKRRKRACNISNYAVCVYHLEFL